MRQTRKHILQLLAQMTQGIYERDEVIALAMLAALAGESIFLLGMPGVGKSLVARRLKLAFRGAKSFEYLMSRFSTPDEIFGPVSISKLKDEDTYERVVDGYLPTADVVFLDEIWKAGPAIQNSLLTALNERIFHNGNHDIRLPLKTIISASNELPAQGEGLEALWDRFLVRYIVKPIARHQAFLNLIIGHDEPCCIDDELLFDNADFGLLQRQARDVFVPDTVRDIICGIRDVLGDTKLASRAMNTARVAPYVSDRRWRKVMGILRMSALLNGRNDVDPSDCLLLEHMLWDNDDQCSGLRRLVADKIAETLRRGLPQTVTTDDLAGHTLVSPVGGCLSPDGKHYVFEAGGEDVLIGIDDYNALNEQVRFATMTSENVLCISPTPAEFTVRVTRPGNIVLNTFTYQLKRETPLRVGTAQDMLDVVNAPANAVVRGMQAMVLDNIFLRGWDEYPELIQAFDMLRFTRETLRGKRR